MPTSRFSYLEQRHLELQTRVLDVCCQRDAAGSHIQSCFFLPVLMLASQPRMERTSASKLQIVLLLLKVTVNEKMAIFQYNGISHSGFYGTSFVLFLNVIQNILVVKFIWKTMG